jgi:hypothetical protein
MSIDATFWRLRFPRCGEDHTGCRPARARTTCPGWLGERLDVGWAIDVLHPRALQPLTIGE